MKYYVQFARKDNRKYDRAEMRWIPCQPYYVDILGSDGVLILDGRNSLTTMIQDAKNCAIAMSSYKRIDGFRIMKGDFKNARQVQFVDFCNIDRQILKKYSGLIGSN